MNKEQALKVLLLLSARESWGFSVDRRIPDYLHENLSEVMNELGKLILEKNT